MQVIGERELEDVRGRWRSGDGPALANEVLSRLLSHQDIRELPLETIGGRVDLRGIAVPLPSESPPQVYNIRLPEGIEFSQTWVRLDGLTEFKGAHLADLDFTGGYLPHLRFFDTRIENCVFDMTQCFDWRLWGSEIRDSSFVDAGLDEFSVGAFYEGRPNQLINIDFRHAILAGTGTQNWGVADVIDCDFSQARIEGVNFWQASLIRCKFAGVLKEVIFDGRVHARSKKVHPNPMEDVDLTGVVSFEGGGFRGINFDRVALPPDPNLIVIRDPSWAERAMARLSGRDDPAAQTAQIWLENIIKFNLPSGSHSLINLNRIQEEDARSLLRSLVADLA